MAIAGRLLLEYNESTKEIHRASSYESSTLVEEVRRRHIVRRRDRVTRWGQAARDAGAGASLQCGPSGAAFIRFLSKSVLASWNWQQLWRGFSRSRRIRHDIRVGWLRCCLVSPHRRWQNCGRRQWALVVAGLSTALGLVARQWLGRHKYNLLTLPLTAAFIGAVFGGLAIRLGWTQTPGLALIVPSLMLVPGPHLINGLQDVVDNLMPMGIARLGLALSILLACACIVIGMKITLPVLPLAEGEMNSDHLNLLLNMLLAGVVTIGFAVFYNAAWLQVGLAAVGGMVGHGIRYVALQADWNLDAATFLGSFAVGLVAASIARSYKLPVAVVSFAGAVTMMPGIQIYRALGGAMQLGRRQDAADLTDIGMTAGFAIEACLVVAALALGLVIGARVVPMFAHHNGALKTERK